MTLNPKSVPRQQHAVDGQGPGRQDANQRQRAA